MVRGDALLLLEPSKPSSARREDFLLGSLSVCLGEDVGKVSKRKDIFTLICKVSGSEHTVD